MLDAYLGQENGPPSILQGDGHISSPNSQRNSCMFWHPGLRNLRCVSQIYQKFSALLIWIIWISKNCRNHFMGLTSNLLSYYCILWIDMLICRQKVPKLDFQSKFFASKCIQTLNTNLGAHFLLKWFFANFNF